MPIEYQNVVRTGLAKQVADEIRDAILTGRLQIDERLPTEEELARRFGISRPTIREALKRLAAQNLIRSQRGPTGGTFVRRPNAENLSSMITGGATLLVVMGAFEIDEIIAARLETESVCCRLACDRRSLSDLQAMRKEIVFQRTAAISDEEFCASDVRFHRALVEAGGNGPLSLMMYMVIESFMPITNMIVSQVRERHTVADFHERIAAAIDGQDAARATITLSELLNYLRNSYTTSLERRTQRDAAKA